MAIFGSSVGAIATNEHTLCCDEYLPLTTFSAVPVLPPIEMPVGVEEITTSGEKDLVIVFPNPAKQETTISFITDEKLDVQLDIYNSAGKKVNRLLDQKGLEKGKHSIVWNGKDESGKAVPNGLYIYRLIAGKQFAGRIVIMR